jgi:hypothetical protein
MRNVDHLFFGPDAVVYDTYIHESVAEDLIPFHQENTEENSGFVVATPNNEKYAFIQEKVLSDAHVWVQGDQTLIQYLNLTRLPSTYSFFIGKFPNVDLKAKFIEPNPVRACAVVMGVRPCGANFSSTKNFLDGQEKILGPPRKKS